MYECLEVVVLEYGCVKVLGVDLEVSKNYLVTIKYMSNISTAML